MHDERDTPVTQLYEVVHDELRAPLVVGRDRVESLAVAVMAHDRERDAHGYLFEFGESHQRGHQHEAAQVMVDRRLDNRFLWEHFKTARRDVQLIRLRANRAGDTVGDEAENGFSMSETTTPIVNVRPRIPRAGPWGR